VGGNHGKLRGKSRDIDRGFSGNIILTIVGERENGQSNPTRGIRNEVKFDDYTIFQLAASGSDFFLLMIPHKKKQQAAVATLGDNLGENRADTSS